MHPVKPAPTMMPNPPLRSRSHKNLLNVLFDISSFFNIVAPFSTLKCICPKENLVSMVNHSLLSKESVAIVTESLSPVCDQNKRSCPFEVTEYCIESPEVPPDCWTRVPGEQVLKLNAMCPRRLSIDVGNVTCEFNVELKYARLRDGVEASSWASEDVTRSAHVETEI